MTKPLILGLGGTARDGSSSEKAMKIALRHAEKLGARTESFCGRDLLMPVYQPGDNDRSEAAARLVELYRNADGIILASPSYHGSLSGLLKNAIDYTEDLRTDRRVYWDGRAIGCICCAGGWQGGSQTVSALRDIAHALRGWPTPFGAVLNTSLPLFDADGRSLDESVQNQLEIVGAQVVEFAMMRYAADYVF